MNSKFFWWSAVLIFLSAAMVAACKRHATKSEDVLSSQQEVKVDDSKTVETADTVFIIYERTPCFGMCPSFYLTIYRSGYAVYEGKNFVNRIGFYRTSFVSTDLEKIVRTAESIGYFSFDDVYDNPHVTDLPTVTTGISKNGELKMVVARYQQPKELKLLHEELDKLIEKAVWVPMEIKPSDK